MSLPRGIIQSIESRDTWRPTNRRFKCIEYKTNKKSTIKLIHMNTSEELLKCRLFHFSLGYAAENFMVAPNCIEAVRGFIFIFTKIKFSLE